MNQWKEVKPEEWNHNPFDKIGKEWMLVTAEKGKLPDCFMGWSRCALGKECGLYLYP